jgi:hypothetical protein
LKNPDGLIRFYKKILDNILKVVANKKINQNTPYLFDKMYLRQHHMNEPDTILVHRMGKQLLNLLLKNITFKDIITYYRKNDRDKLHNLELYLSGSHTK